MSRNTLLFIGIWPAAYLIMKNWNENRRQLFSFILYGILPMVVMGVSFLIYNWARFGNPFEVGTKYQNMAGTLRENVITYGYFSTHYIKSNFYYHYIYYPLPETAETLMGGSLFLLSPVFFAAIRWNYSKGNRDYPSFFL